MNDAHRAGVGTRSAPPLGGGALRAYRRLLGYLRPYRGRFIVGILGGVLFSATMASFALLAKKFGDGTFTHQDPRTIVWVPLALIGLFILRGLGDFTQTYFMGYVGRRIVSQLRREVFRHILHLPIGYFDRSSSAALLSRLTYNTEQIGQATTDSVIIVVRTALTIIASVGFLLWLNVRLTLIALVMGPLVGWLVSVINRRFRRYSRRIQDSMGDVTRVAKEGFEAPRLIKVYNAEEHLGRQFDAVNDRNLRSNMKLVLTRGVSNPTVQLVTVVGLAFVPNAPNERAYPTAALDAVRSGSGVLLNEYDWGGYLIWRAPERPVFVDGRLFPFLPDVFADWREAVELGPRWKDVLDRYKVAQVLLRPDRALVSALREQGWRVVTEDGLAVLLERPR